MKNLFFANAFILFLYILKSTVISNQRLYGLANVCIAY